MSKVKYYYDPDTLSYRKIEPKKSRKYRNIFFFILGAALFGFIALIFLLNARQGQKVFNDGIQAVYVLLNDCQKAFAFFGSIYLALLHSFNKTLNSRQWCFYLMRNVRHKILTHVFKTPQLSDIVKYHQGTNLLPIRSRSGELFTSITRSSF